MSDKKSYNLWALKGDNIDDMEYVDMYGLDPSVAYTPAINDAMIDTVYRMNIEDPSPNKEPEQARKDAIKTRDTMRGEVKRLYATLGILRDVKKKR